MIVLLYPIPRKYLERLNELNKSRIIDALRGLEEEPPKGDIISVTSQPQGYFRLKIGSYRALFRYRDDHILLRILIHVVKCTIEKQGE